MRDKEFAMAFKLNYEKLERFFCKRLKKAPFGSDQAILADDLIQLTGMIGLEYSRNSRWNTYSEVKLIFLKAEDVWIDFSREMKKKILPRSLEEMEIGSTQPNPQRLLELREDVATYEVMVDEETKTILELLENGLTYNDISAALKKPGNALKMKIFRFRQRLKNQIDKHL